jgi:demethylmenaquinone methyltransferase/2-methoxy-6-polyprenyl-1,4-benzoquinol methylase
VAAEVNLDKAFDAPEIKRRYVRRLFATIADRYDLITVVLSFGRDRAWKRRLVQLANVRPGARVMDLACGTGDIGFEAAAHGGVVTGLDITPRMIELARTKERARGLATCSWVVGDMTALPMANAAFDVITTGYGLRNVPDLPRALAEMHRVLKAGGVACSLDFDKPESRVIRGVYLSYLSAVGSALGWLLHRDPDTYRYIPASIRRYPGSRGVAELMRLAGFIEVRTLPVFGGFMAIHVGRKSEV